MVAFGNKYPYITEINPEQKTALLKKFNEMSPDDLDELIDKTSKHAGPILHLAMFKDMES